MQVASFKAIVLSAAGLLCGCLSDRDPAPEPLAAPRNLQADPGVESVSLSWAKVSAAGSYRIYYASESGVGPDNYSNLRNGKVELVTGVSHVVTGLAGSRAYYFVVTAVDGRRESNPSSELSATPTVAPPPPAPPRNLGASVGNGIVSLQWTPVTGATGYNIYLASESGPGPDNWHALRNGASLSSTGAARQVGGLTNHVTYFFAVTATNGSGESDASVQISATPVPPPAQVNNVAATAGNREVALGWPTAANSATYYLYYAAEPGVSPRNYAALDRGGRIATADTRALVGGLDNDTTYYFAVAGHNEAGDGPLSSPVSATPRMAPPAPSNLVLEPRNGAIAASWSATPGATAYRVYRASQSGIDAISVDSLTDGAAVTTAATAIVLDALSNGTEYFVVVAGINHTVEGNASEEMSAIPQASPPAPDGVSATAGDQSAQLEWNTATGATAYSVYLAAESGVTPQNYTSLSSGRSFETADAELFVSPLDNDTTYYFVVTARNSFGESAASPQGSVTPEPPPSTNAELAGLAADVGALEPAFDANVLAYALRVSFFTAAISITATTADAGASLSVAGQAAASGVPSAATVLTEGDNLIDIEVTAEDGVTVRTYGLSVTRESAGDLLQQAIIKASNTGVEDKFGYSMALHGDTLVLGAPYEDSSGRTVDSGVDDDEAANSGAAYVFVRNGGVWQQQAHLKAANADPEDQFGHSVAIDGDTIAVGAIGESNALSGVDVADENNSAGDSGAVYVFVRNNAGNWEQQAYMKPFNTGAADLFGTSVSLSGDTLAVGAPQERSQETGTNGTGGDNSATAAGAAYVFIRDGVVWSQEAYIKASNTEERDRFGSQVALSGNTLAVSAPDESSADASDQDSNAAPKSGAVYIYVRGTGTSLWTQQAFLKAENADLSDGFGKSLALDADRLIVGTPHEDGSVSEVDGAYDNDSPNAGAAYIFDRDGADWLQQSYLKAGNNTSGDSFGSSVAVHGDTVIIGAPGEDGNSVTINTGADDNEAPDAGAAYVFERQTDGSWLQSVYLKAANGERGDRLGGSVAVAGDSIAVGAAREDGGSAGVNTMQNNDARDAGAAYVFIPH